MPYELTLIYKHQELLGLLRVLNEAYQHSLLIVEIII